MAMAGIAHHKRHCDLPCCDSPCQRSAVHRCLAARPGHGCVTALVNVEGAQLHGATSICKQRGRKRMAKGYVPVSDHMLGRHDRYGTSFS